MTPLNTNAGAPDDPEPVFVSEDSAQEFITEGSSAPEDAEAADSEETESISEEEAESTAEDDTAASHEETGTVSGTDPEETDAAPGVPAVPESVTATSGTNAVTIRWTASEGAVSYRIYRSESNILSGVNAEKKIAEVDSSVLSFKDSGVQDGMIYEYYVTAVNEYGESTRDPFLRGAYAWTSYIVPGVYGIKVTGLTKDGFTVSGMAVSSAGLGSVRIPVWTEKNGQDDLVWYDASVSGNSFTVSIKTAAHLKETGNYNVHVYCSDKNGKPGGVYALNVNVPDGKAHLSDPFVSGITADSYELALTFEAPSGVSSVKVATYTEKEGKKNYKETAADINTKDGIIRASVRTKDHGNYKGNYYTTVFLTDKKGNTDSHTFTVKITGEARPLSSVTTVNVLQGDATLAESGGEYLLIDAGPLEASGRKLVRVLKEHRAKDLTVIISHPHSDHIEGLRELINSISVKAVYLNNVVSDYWFDNFIRSETVKALEAKGIPVYGTPEAGTAIRVGALTATVIGPARYYSLGEKSATNNNSLYIRIEGNGKRYLLAGDSEKEAEADMLAAGADVKADYFKASHHGFASSNSAAFISAVAARTVLFSTYTPPSADVAERFKNAGAAIYRTSAGGSIAVQLTEDGAEWVLKHDKTETNSKLKPVLIRYGDVNSDGKWDVIDVSYMYAHVLGKKKLTGNMFNAADINGDKKVNVIDISYVYAYILKKAKTVPQR
ncbi:MAG: GBS Bsp-like repeat-containing protein [Lachnospiraceae bacterium]|nr:GBS Bsp-like repeat-containing protein [Lachnospiraceae bacterium]